MKKMMERKGFTLVEMLIVMAVVVVLAAAALPVVTNQTEAAKQSNDLAALRDAYVAAYTEVAIKEAGGLITGTSETSSQSVTLQSGKFDKLSGASIATVSLASVELDTSKDVVFTFAKQTTGGVSLSGIASATS